MPSETTRSRDCPHRLANCPLPNEQLCSMTTALEATAPPDNLKPSVSWIRGIIHFLIFCSRRRGENGDVMPPTEHKGQRMPKNTEVGQVTGEGG